MMDSETPPVFHVDKGAIKFSNLTFFSFIFGFTIIIGSAVLLYSKIPSKEDMKEVFTEHAAQLATIHSIDAQQDKDISQHTKSLETLNENTRYIRGRIDFLTEQTIIESQGDVATRRATSAAAQRVRATAKARGESDPLSGVGDL